DRCQAPVFRVELPIGERLGPGTGVQLMSSRLLPLALAICALLADGGGLHGLAFWLVLLALPCAASAAFVAVSDALEGNRGWLSGVTASVSLLLLVLGSTVREHAARGAHVPTL